MDNTQASPETHSKAAHTPSEEDVKKVVVTIPRPILAKVYKWKVARYDRPILSSVTFVATYQYN